MHFLGEEKKYFIIPIYFEKTIIFVIKMGLCRRIIFPVKKCNFWSSLTQKSRFEFCDNTNSSTMYTTTTFFKNIIFIAIPLQIFLFAQSRGNLFYNEANHYSAPIRSKSYCWVLFQCLFNITLHIATN